jgi:hypothetical protein
MNKQISLSALSDELTQVRTKKKEFLTQIERFIPWAEWLALLQPCYDKGERGNKPYLLEMMLRLYRLQNLYNLSDEAAPSIANQEPFVVVTGAAQTSRAGEILRSGKGRACIRRHQEEISIPENALPRTAQTGCGTEYVFHIGKSDPD